jgi:hypothetical protein
METMRMDTATMEQLREDRLGGTTAEEEQGAGGITGGTTEEIRPDKHSSLAAT